MKLKKIIVFSMIGVGVAYSGVKGYIYYKVKNQVDQMVVVARPFADIEYGSIGSDLQGRVMLDDLVLYPRGINDTVKVDRLTVITPGLEFLLSGSESLKQGEIPEHMGLALTGIHLDLNGRLTEMLEQMEAAQLGYGPADGIACSLSSNFMTTQYRELGLKELVFDTAFRFEHGDSASQLRLKMDYNMRGMEALEIVITMDGVGHSVMGLAMGSPQLQRVSMNWRPDAAFTHKTLDYCAGQQGMDVPTYIDGLFGQSDEDYAEDLGFVPGPGIRAAMKELMQNAGELNLVAQPASSLDLKSVYLYKPEDWPDLFGLIVKVNGKEVTDLSFTLPDIDPSQGDEQSADFSFPAFDFLGQQEQPVQAQSQKKPKVAPARSSRPRYRIVPRGEVNTLVGRSVRILTADGKRRSGRVLNISNGVISLEMRMHAGTMSTTVPVKAAKKIEVLERG
jgi:hypothetical protein